MGNDCRDIACNVSTEGGKAITAKDCTTYGSITITRDEREISADEVYPNPASQRFRVDIELKDNSPVDLYLINTGAGVVSAHKRLSGAKTYSEWFEVPTDNQ
jgi:hypothetical protein